jgi:predicted MFS family arabinose efflux permease
VNTMNPSQTAGPLPAAASASSPSAATEWRSGWPLVFSSAVAMIMAGIPTASMGVFIGPLQQAFGWSRATITGAILTHALCVLCLSPLVGRIIHRYGARRVGLMGIVAVGFAIAGAGLSGPGIASWYLAWVLVGIAQTFAGPIIWSSAIVRKFNTSRGLALAVMLSGTAVATAIIAPITLFLITTWGWRAAYWAFGAGAIAICFPLIWWLFRDPVAASPVALKNEPAASAQARSKAAAQDFAQSWRTVPFLKMVVCTIGVALALATLFVHMVPILKDRGLSPAEAVSVVAVLGVSQLVARLLGGHLLDRFFAPYVGAAMFLLVGVGCLLLPTVTISLPVAMLIGVLVGAGLGLELDLMAYLVSRYFRLGAYPSCYGVLLGIYGIGFGAGAVLAGAAFDRLGSYDPMLWTMLGVLVACGALMASLGRYPTFPDVAAASKA